MSQMLLIGCPCCCCCCCPPCSQIPGTIGTPSSPQQQASGVPASFNCCSGIGNPQQQMRFPSCFQFHSHKCCNGLDSEDGGNSVDEILTIGDIPHEILVSEQQDSPVAPGDDQLDLNDDRAAEKMIEEIVDNLLMSRPYRYYRKEQI